MSHIYKPHTLKCWNLEYYNESQSSKI